MSREKLHSRLSIRQKIILIILTVTSLSIITGFAIEIYSNIKTSKNELKDNITLDAKLIADYLVPAFLFNDQSGANEILTKLANIPAIVYGGAYTPDGNRYAEYSTLLSSDSLQTLSQVLQLSENKKEFPVKVAVISNGEILGMVVLIATTHIVREKTNQHLRSILIIFAISILLAFFLAFWLERIISGPILRLAEVTGKIQKTFDYSVRVKKEANDETGVLYEGFNNMLQSIETRKIERDTAQQKLQEERANLELRVIERTKELNAAKEKAEESDKLKSAFLANMSHEIRTPLNAILGFSSLIRDTSPTPAELEEYYRMMETSGNDLVNLIDDILDISRIEANQIRISPVDTSVGQLAEEVFSTFKRQLYSEDVHNPVTPVFVAPPGKDDFVINTDPHRLKQILLNILNNAIKFTPKGSIEFCYFPNEEHTQLIFSITDTGIGIAKNQQEKIFERFTKVADIKTKHYRGTGLGLSIALKLTQLLNGNISVESELNIGTAFYLSFPLSKVLSPAAAVEQKPTDESLGFLTGKTILIVEDVEFNFRYLEIILTKNQNVKILWAKSGLEAVDLVKKNPGLDCVLMDIQLPEMNGLDATLLIKKDNPNLPVIAQTAYGTSSDIEDCSNAGCVDILIKPINKSTLLETLKKHIA